MQMFIDHLLPQRYFWTIELSWVLVSVYVILASMIIIPSIGGLWPSIILVAVNIMQCLLQYNHYLNAEWSYNENNCLSVCHPSLIVHSPLIIREFTVIGLVTTSPAVLRSKHQAGAHHANGHMVTPASITIIQSISTTNAI